MVRNNNAAARTSTSTPAAPKNLTRASRQWSERPDDQRFYDFAELTNFLTKQANESRTQEATLGSLRAVAEGDDVRIQGQNGNVSYLTPFAFGQLSGFVKAPAAYLAKLPAELAAENLNYGLMERKNDKTMLLFHQNKAARSLTLRAATGMGYSRIWDCTIANGLESLTTRGWKVPPARAVPGVRSRPATQADVLAVAGHPGLSVRVGDLISPSGLYASDRDFFAFMVDDSKRIDVDGASLCRGFFCWNSEVGAKSLGFQTFLFDSVCGNHIVWGAQGVKTIKVRHVGEEGALAERWELDIMRQLTTYANASTADDIARIKATQGRLLGKDKDEVVDVLFNKKTLGLSRKVLDAAYTVVETTPRYGDPRSAWGIANGLTELSQQERNTDQRVALDRSAGKVLEFSF